MTPLKSIIRFVCSLIFLLTLASLATWNGPRKVSIVLATAQETPASIVLSDHTVVWFTKNSSLIFPVRFSSHRNREVTLKGEALFEIPAGNPFIVYSTGFVVTAYQATFTIMKSEKSLEVIVLTNEISVAIPKLMEIVELGPLDRLILKPGSRPSFKVERAAQV